MSDDDQSTSRGHRRFALVFDVVVFQFKLIADSVRDLLLSPVSIVAAILGLVSGGDEPERYFERLKRFGRRSDVWINLFGTYRRGPTSDAMIEPLKDRVFAEYERGGALAKGAQRINAALDEANRRAAKAQPSGASSGADEGSEGRDGDR